MSLTSAVEIHESENNLYVVQHKYTNKYVKMGQREVDFLRLLLETGELETANQTYSGSLTEEERAYLAEKFSSFGFLDKGPPDGGGDQSKSGSRWRFNWRVEDITTIKFLSVDPDEGLNRSLPLIRKLVHPAAVGFYLVLILAAGWLLGSDQGLADKLNPGSLGLLDFVTIYVMILLTTVIHELAHGMVCKYYGGRVRQMGVMLFYFSLAMFCDVSDTYVFKKKKHKLAVLFAGIYSQWLMTALAVITFYGLEAAGIHAAILLYYALANLGLSFLNMIPLVKLDGYWMLSHGLGIANLRTKAFQALFQLITPWRRKQTSAAAVSPVTTTVTPRKGERSILLAYGLAAGLFTPLFWSWGLYNVQQRLYSMLGAASFIITAGIVCILLYHFAKFCRTMSRTAASQ